MCAAPDDSVLGKSAGGHFLDAVKGDAAAVENGVEMEGFRENAAEVAPHGECDRAALGFGLFREGQFEMAERAAVALEERRNPAPQGGADVRGRLDRQARGNPRYSAEDRIFEPVL